MTLGPSSLREHEYIVQCIVSLRAHDSMHNGSSAKLFTRSCVTIYKEKKTKYVTMCTGWETVDDLRRFNEQTKRVPIRYTHVKYIL